MLDGRHFVSRWSCALEIGPALECSQNLHRELTTLKQAGLKLPLALVRGGDGGNFRSKGSAGVVLPRRANVTTVRALLLERVRAVHATVQVVTIVAVLVAAVVAVATRAARRSRGACIVLPRRTDVATVFALLLE